MAHRLEAVGTLSQEDLSAAVECSSQRVVGSPFRRKYDEKTYCCHPVTTKTAGCNLRVFSWQCLGDQDYRYALAMASYKNSAPIHLRYSEYACHSFTADMLLLTV